MAASLVAHSQDTYSRELRNAARGLWRGELNPAAFFDSVQSTIRREIRFAWIAGAREAGIKASELTMKEELEILDAIVNETQHITVLGQFVQAKSQNAYTVKGTPKKYPTPDVYARLDLWALRYLDIKNKAKMMAAGDPKLKWLLGNRKEHCPSCLKLANKVKRASTWLDIGVRPQNPPNPFLKCGGWG